MMISSRYADSFANFFTSRHRRLRPARARLRIGCTFSLTFLTTLARPITNSIPHKRLIFTLLQESIKHRPAGYAIRPFLGRVADPPFGFLRAGNSLYCGNHLHGRYRLSDGNITFVAVWTVRARKTAVVLNTALSIRPSFLYRTHVPFTTTISLKPCLEIWSAPHCPGAQALSNQYPPAQLHKHVKFLHSRLSEPEPIIAPSGTGGVCF